MSNKISIKDCQDFLYNYIYINFEQDKKHEYYIHKEIDLWLIIYLKERNFMPSYFIFDSNNKMVCSLESPFEVEDMINNYIRKEKIKKLKNE